MSMDPNNNHPSFSKLLQQGYTNKIRMPGAFVKEHKKMLAKTCLLKTDEGLSWEAKIVKETSHYFMCEGDWPRFLQHHKFESGDMLIFYLVEKSTFHVLLYSKKSLTNIRHFEELSSSDEEEAAEEKGEVKNVEASRKANKVKMEPVQLSYLGDKSDSKADNMLGVEKKANEVKMEPVILSDSEEERVDPSSDWGNPCYWHPGGKSNAKADNMLGVKKKAPVKIFRELIELSDSEEETVDPFPGSKEVGNTWCSHPGYKFNGKADNMINVKKKALWTKEAKKAAKDPNKHKMPARCSFVKRGWKSARDPNKPKKPAGAFFLFMKDFRKQFKEENPKDISLAAGGEKWKQLSDAEKAPYMAEVKKRMEEYYKNKAAYNRRVAAGDSEEEESYKSKSEVDEEEGGDD
ncbi:High mobility group B protein 2 [Capsicum chinense]|nr:High mobility group B protein 2 [Capsicum chinense]